MKGPRVRVPTPGKNARRAFFGALDPVDGAWFWRDSARKRADDFVPFLEQLAAAHPAGPLYLVLDGAPAHTAKSTRAWFAAHPRVRPLPVPAYAAHHENPVERVWGSMKTAVAANRLAGSIDELTAAARRFFADLTPHPAALPAAA